jgi:hypothetical protein
VAVYDATPAALPSSLTSESFEAQSISELGDYVKLVPGTGRNLSKVTVVMVTYHAMPQYTWPLTLKLYDPTNLTKPFSYVTRTFVIPARHAATENCTDGMWMGSDGVCHNGEAFELTFDLAGTILPEEFVYTVGYDTQHYGAHPAGVDGPYNNLNVGLSTDAPSIGDRGNVYVNSSWAGENGPYGDNGATGVLRSASGWGNYHPAVKFQVAP